MFRQIVVPLDGSERAEQVLPVAARLARATQSGITLLQVVDLTYTAISYGMGAPYISQRLIEDEISRARNYLEQWRHDRTLEGIMVQTQAVAGDPATVITTRAAELPIGLVVISSHGYTGMKRWLLGSVAEKVAQHALVPVLILHDNVPLHFHQTTEGRDFVRALVPLDTSPRSQDALAPAAEMVAALSAGGRGELRLAQMVVSPDRAGSRETEELLASARQNLATIGQTMRDGLVARFWPELYPALSWTVALTDDIAEGIVRLAESGEGDQRTEKGPECDLIVLTTHGAGGMRHWPVGSVAARVLHATSLPTLIVRPEDMIVKEHLRHPHQTPATV
ncbi:MAG TPA: universal stress protein [Ktedonobacteraceae bacterium]